ncbi:hypothetical protein PTTG_26581 [Puccinia triticina 1-1 BBBD Race 1]|uniref:Uncharacterized protein n=1 Tax=Puccinia triticina (isolate 1-1 / race 1 (BBBD)) TaxID=630390 RepID=A0A180GT90_PUCT1|nr:hypothetical protein PTTG_26581 [Puccinia triticina 1-1 BBBD Race 1]
MANLSPTFIKFFILLVLKICLVNRRVVVAVNLSHEEPATQLEFTERTHQFSSAPRQHRTNSGEESAGILISLPSTSHDTSISGGIGDSASHSNHQPGDVEFESIETDDRPAERGHGGATSSGISVPEINSHPQQDVVNAKVHSSDSPPRSVTILAEYPQQKPIQIGAIRINPGDKNRKMFQTMNQAMTQSMVRQTIRLQTMIRLL